MQFKSISILALVAILFSGVEPFCAILVEGIMRKLFSEIILNFTRDQLKTVLFLILVVIFSLELTHLCNFGRGHYGEHSREWVSLT